MKLNDYKLKHLMSNSVLKSIDFGEIRVVLLNVHVKEFVPIEGIKNLLAIDPLQNIVWIADLPSNNRMYSAYQDIEKKGEELLAWSGSFLCTLDIKSGVITDERFVK